MTQSTSSTQDNNDNNHHRESTGSRKRSRPVAIRLGLAAVATAAMCCSSSPVSAFTTTPHAPLVGRSSVHSSPVITMAASTTTSTAIPASNNKSYKSEALSAGPPRLSHDEQRELLLQAIELRRIQTLESELTAVSTSITTTTTTAKSSSSDIPLLINLGLRSNAAGYGDDLDAYDNAVLDGQLAREALITTNMGLVHYTVNEIIGTHRNAGGSKKRLNSLSREDLIQEGSIGLARAIDRWNPAIGGKFSTYAVYWVRATVLRGIAEKDDLLRIPEHVSTAVRKMTRGAAKLGLELDNEEIGSTTDSIWKEAKAAKALALEAGLTDKQLTEAMRIRARRNTGGYVEFESWMQKGANLESDVSTVASRDHESSNALRGVEMEDLKTTLGRYLRPKEMEALFWRYGLLNESSTSASSVETVAPVTATKKNKKVVQKQYLALAEEELYGSTATTTQKTTKSKKAQIKQSLPEKGRWGEAMTFTEVGKRMEVSAEYTRRLCHAALKKLRQAADDGLLEPALLY